MLESKIEDYLVKRVKALGGACDKLVMLNRKGNPDRWCFFPSGFLLIVELKKKGEKPTVLQQRRIAELRGLGQVVEVADSIEAVDDLFTKYKERIKA